MKVVGVDGCKAGWLAIWLDRKRGHGVQVYRNIAALWQACSDAKVILIDIPSGLPNRKTRVRACDCEARAMLGPGKGSSVFPAPCRPALGAKSYAQACRLNSAEIGKMISQQCFNICHKIREVDVLLQTNPDARRRIREVHPEICFGVLNGGAPLQHSKKMALGFAARLHLLKRYFAPAQQIVDFALTNWPRTAVAKDDVLDALVAAFTALKPEDLISIPASPQQDDMGLPMEMVYREFEVADSASACNS